MRLIDADKLIRKYIDTDIEKFSNSDVKIVFENLKQNILKAPSIDIVRCEECMHNGSYDTDCPFGWRNGEWNMPKPCDFCSYGERNK